MIADAFLTAHEWRLLGVLVVVILAVGAIANRRL